MRTILLTIRGQFDLVLIPHVLTWNSRSIYLELAEQYGLMDATSNVSKRNVLADHLREVVDVLEQKVCGIFASKSSLTDPVLF